MLSTPFQKNENFFYCKSLLTFSYFVFIWTNLSATKFELLIMNKKNKQTNKSVESCRVEKEVLIYLHFNEQIDDNCYVNEFCVNKITE